MSPQIETVITSGCFEDVFNDAPIAFLILDRSGRTIKANGQACQLLGQPQQYIINTNLEEFISPIDFSKYRFFLSDFVKQADYRVLEIRLRKLGQQPQYVECRVTASSKQRLLMAMIDITERRQTEEAIIYQHESFSEKIRHQLMEREIKLNSIFNASIEGIVTFDPQGFIVSINSAVETIFGYLETELINANIEKLLPVFKRWQKNYRKNKLITSFIGKIQEVEGIHKNGSVLLLDLSIVEYSIDNTVYFTGIVRDVSLRKKQEQQNKEHLEKLAHVTRLGVMGEMASGIAHEVNQPLTAVVNYTQACIRQINTAQPDLAKLSETLQKTYQQALKAGQIMHSMREFVKPRKIHRATADINQVILEAINLLDADLKKYDIRLNLALEKNLPHVYIDGVQIEQVLLNLVKNSIEALRELPSFTPRQLTVQTHLTPKDYIEIKVKDNGLGLNDEQREKILTPFYTTKSTGMGMGLSISRSLVEAHDGVLHFNSKQDKGTTFYFTLPVWNSANGAK